MECFNLKGRVVDIEGLSTELAGNASALEGAKSTLTLRMRLTDFGSLSHAWCVVNNY
jgi:hypothetical protein